MNERSLNRILVVDDEEEYRLVVGRFLEALHYEAATAVNGRRGLEMMDNERFDLVISDIRMAEMDGIQFMREARQSYPHVEFVIMTGHAAQYSYSEIIGAGAADFISKPFDVGKLKSKLERIDRERRLRLQLHEANEALRRMNAQLKQELAEKDRMSHELREARDKLEGLLSERTAKLDRAGDILKRSMDRFRQISSD